MIPPRIINFVCLLLAAIIILILPLKKEIWYDETVSVLISKGINHDTPASLSQATTLSSDEIASLNTNSNVFRATVLDNANSYIYNICLHWFTLLFGNSLATYMLFSKLCGIAALIAFYVFCNLLFRQSLFTSLAILLVTTDTTFTGMSHEVRAYALGIFFVLAAAIYLYKFLYQNDKPIYLLLTGLCSVAAVLTHFLSVYIVLVFIATILLEKKAKLFSLKNTVALLIPIGLIAYYFYCAYPGLAIMSRQNAEIQHKHVNEGVAVTEVLLRSARYTAVNFKSVFSAFSANSVIAVLSFILLPILYITGLRHASGGEKRTTHLLFAMGISGTFFLAFLSFRSQHYTALYHRYYSFCVPFCSLFTAYVLYLLSRNNNFNNLLKAGIISIFAIPACLLFFITAGKKTAKQKFNHIAVANQIVRDHVTKADVPEWQDALLLQCFLPEGYKINYTLNPSVPIFTLYKTDATVSVPVVKDNS